MEQDKKGYKSMIKINLIWIVVLVLHSLGALIAGDKIGSCVSGLWALFIAICVLCSPEVEDLYL